MQSQKFIFYISRNTEKISFDKNMMFNDDNELKYNEIHITQLYILPNLKKSIDILNSTHTGLLQINIEKFNYNIIGSQNYTFSLLDMMTPYKYNGMCASKITDKSTFTMNGEKIELRIGILIGGEDLRCYTDNVDENLEFADDEDLIHMELLFK